MKPRGWACLLAVGLGAAIWFLAAKPPILESKVPARQVPDRSARPLRGSSTADSSPSPRPDGSPAVTDEILDRWLRQASKDTPGTLAEVIGLQDETLRGELLEWILAAWMSDGRQEVLNWLERNVNSMDPEPAGEVMDLVLGPWGATQPHEAADWVRLHLGPAHSETGLRIVAGSWAVADPSSMGEWIRAVQPKDELWRDELVDAWIRVNPLETMEWCASDPDREWAGRARQMVIQTWLITAPEAAKAYLKEHPDLAPDLLPDEPPTAIR